MRMSKTSKVTTSTIGIFFSQTFCGFTIKKKKNSPRSNIKKIPKHPGITKVLNSGNIGGRSGRCWRVQIGVLVED